MWEMGLHQVHYSTRISDETCLQAPLVVPPFTIMRVVLKQLVTAVRYSNRALNTMLSVSQAFKPFDCVLSVKQFTMAAPRTRKSFPRLTIWMSPNPLSLSVEDFFAGDESLNVRSPNPIVTQREAQKLQERIDDYKQQQLFVLHTQEVTNTRRRSDVPPRPVAFVDEQVSLIATLADSDSDGEDDHFRLWTVYGCIDATSHIDDLVANFSRGKSPAALARSVFARFCKASGTKDAEKKEKAIRGNLQFGISHLYELHERIHRVQHALYQLTGQESAEYHDADAVGCNITKYIAMLSDLQNHILSGNVDMFESMGFELFLFMSEPEVVG
ncbi:hypothetical protein CONPUDRAFT_69154 [Coniophora puteana RWD-64-598 SS2]|uniref:Uncharacterized protein n=1 Tax=Coniophora puteana (strain RWD-64-598) TaxID=741705 RepID=A0A5M3N6P2_CONPW|nr:uncharacterized protein CONPUDRAFT_69154 [Coniophora puteana RWD-64-598 SS2]EIW86724.1 hypothetical protein CONPUDRAFT_69154 [Coniophora puteana RWD-64-598 SS2]